jgi:hypothetical protein
MKDMQPNDLTYQTIIHVLQLNLRRIQPNRHDHNDQEYQQMKTSNRLSTIFNQTYSEFNQMRAIPMPKRLNQCKASFHSFTMFNQGYSQSNQIHTIPTTRPFQKFNHQISHHRSSIKTNQASFEYTRFQ